MIQIPCVWLRLDAKTLLAAILASAVAFAISPALAAAAGTPRQSGGQPVDSDCWGQVNKVFGNLGLTGRHASDPIPGDDDRETPRSGVGNQAEDTPSDHAAVVSQFDGIDETFCTTE